MFVFSSECMIIVYVAECLLKFHMTTQSVASSECGIDILIFTISVYTTNW